MSRLTATLFILLSSFSSLRAEDIPLSEIMTREEMQATGIDSLTLVQKRALEQWIARWTHRVIEQAPSYRSGDELSSWISRWPSFASPTKTQFSQAEVQARGEHNQKIDKIKNNGEILELKDGSSWKVGPVYRSLAANWHRNDMIQISPSANVRHPYILYNVSRNETVQGDMVSPTAPGGVKQPGAEEVATGSIPLTAIIVDAYTTAKLADGSDWKIAPVDIYRVRKWHPHDRILVQPSDNFLYKYKLKNIDTGEEVLANPKK